MTQTLPVPFIAGNQLVPSGDIDQYIAKVRQIPILNAEEEQKLIDAYYYHQDLDAAQALIIHHLKFVVHIARGFSGYGLPLGDLIQEGNIGLMKAVKRFEPHHGVRLVSFAVHWIKSEIHEYIIRNWRMVKIATTKAQRKLFFNLRSLKKGINWLSDHEAQSIAEELNVPVREVYEMEKRMHGQDIAFDLDDNDDDSPFSPSAWLHDDHIDPAEQTEHDETRDRLQNQLQNGLALLDNRSREIVQARWLNEDSKETLQSLADRYGVSAERIRQIEQQAMNTLRGHIDAPESH
ncbi:MAG: RNA polymerase sigma factor RpoH [Cardiobacteriaceae bacterium]|nr:RNA polymerase sigma factor RpoH [Cardiobacteriaceae bacterium]